MAINQITCIYIGCVPARHPTFPAGVRPEGQVRRSGLKGRPDRPGWPSATLQWRSEGGGGGGGGGGAHKYRVSENSRTHGHSPQIQEAVVNPFM